MYTHPQPSPVSINIDPEFDDRFWYWHGASGHRYIHSVYPAKACPVLPGAVYISVRRIAGDQFVPLSIEVADVIGQLTGMYAAADGTDEVHVHLLADDDTEAREIRDDLKAGLFPLAVNKVAVQSIVTADLQYSLLAGLEAQTAVLV